MTQDGLYMFLEKYEWHRWDDDLDCSVPTDICPVHVIKEFNENSFDIAGGTIIGSVPPEYDPYVTVEKFVQMRDRAGYPPRLIEIEMTFLFSKKEITKYRKRPLN